MKERLGCTSLRAHALLFALTPLGCKLVRTWEEFRPVLRRHGRNWIIGREVAYELSFCLHCHSFPCASISVSFSPCAPRVVPTTPPARYALGALHTHGLVKGQYSWPCGASFVVIPWSLGGVDEVPARGKWTGEAWVPPADWAGYDDPLGTARHGMNNQDFSAGAEHHA